MVERKEKNNFLFLIFLINALSHHQHEYVFEICHEMTTYLQFSAKHEMKKKTRKKEEE